MRPARVGRGEPSLFRLTCEKRFGIEEGTMVTAEENHQRRLSIRAQKLHFREAAQRQLPEGVALPPKDAPILLAAIEVRADNLLTGDFHDFGSLFWPQVGRRRYHVALQVL